MQIYFAGPLFCEAERDFNLRLTERLEERGFSVFLPQRDGVELDEPPYNTMPTDQRQKLIFGADRDQILAADIFLFVLDGRVPDEGACVELGIAHEQKQIGGKDMLLIGLMTDWRAAFPWAKLNAMIDGALDRVTSTEEELIAALEEYRNSSAPKR